MFLFFCLFTWSDEVVGVWDIHSDDAKPGKVLRSESLVFFPDGRLWVETPGKQVKIRYRIEGSQFDMILPNGNTISNEFKLEGDRFLLKNKGEGYVTYVRSDRALTDVIETTTTTIGDLSLQLTPGWVRDTDQDSSKEGVTFAFFMNEKTETFLMVFYFQEGINTTKDQAFQSIVGGFVQSMTGSDNMAFEDVSGFHGFKHPAKVMDIVVEGEKGQLQAAWGHAENGQILILTGANEKFDPKDLHVVVGSIRVKGEPVIGP